MSGFMITVLTGGVGISFAMLAVRALWAWQGPWQWALALPVLVISGVVLKIFIAIWLDPTAHNLWPLELLIWFLLADFFIGFLHLARWIMHRPLRT